MELSHDTHARDASACLWMQAGVVKRHRCTLDYDCPACRFDRVMRRAADENQRLQRAGIRPAGPRSRIVCWREKLKALPPNRQPCLHTMKGRIDFRPCTHAYRCGDCEFDQYFQDQFSVYADIRPVAVMEVVGIQVPQGYYLHPGHTWARLEQEDTVRVGVDDFARRLLGPPDRIEAPLLGRRVSQGRPAIRVHRGGRETLLVSPLSGVITDVNLDLGSRGDPAHKAPYTDGWVLRLHADNLRQELKALMMGGETPTFFDEELHQLYGEIEDCCGPMATDGGFLGEDVSGNLPQMDWNRVLGRFFRTG
jgi:glycine cleavage system H lipoate-binding protein